MRDEFTVSIKEELAKRVGYLCSNPSCRQPTSGPKSTPSGTVNIGVAAHITAASSGGPRYDDSFSSDDRGSSGNGIWLCQTCAKLVDNDQSRYTVDKLREWKSDAEAAKGLAKRRSRHHIPVGGVRNIWEASNPVRATHESRDDHHQFTVSTWCGEALRARVRCDDGARHAAMDG